MKKYIINIKYAMNTFEFILAWDPVYDFIPDFLSTLIVVLRKSKELRSFFTPQAKSIKMIELPRAMNTSHSIAN